jgi:hypothetical protein
MQVDDENDSVTHRTNANPIAILDAFVRFSLVLHSIPNMPRKVVENILQLVFL